MGLEQTRTSLDEPRLPPELEREIFETAAVSCPTSIPTLMLIAERVKEWVELLLYRVVMVTSFRGRVGGFSDIPLDILLRAIAMKPPFLGSNFTFSGGATTESSVGAILAACSAVTHLSSLRLVPSHLNSLASLRSLSHLTVIIQTLFPRNIDFTHPLFRNATHLELLDYPFSQNTARALCIGLSLIPNLTHFAFYDESLCIHLRPFLGTTLGQLHCIITRSESYYTEEAVHRLSHDERFVCIVPTNFNFLDGWVRSPGGGEDYWAIVEAFIAARRAGKVDRSSTVYPMETIRGECDFSLGPAKVHLGLVIAMAHTSPFPWAGYSSDLIQLLILELILAIHWLWRFGSTVENHQVFVREIENHQIQAQDQPTN
ncbi:hypothetical protein B0H19DRAFT_1066440 [Mycena capillaripes]|nr:hypothetical protein B0H19DRAFT_1066440 [Mycena capillaripes]